MQELTRLVGGLVLALGGRGVREPAEAGEGAQGQGGEAPGVAEWGLQTPPSFHPAPAQLQPSFHPGSAQLQTPRAARRRGRAMGGEAEAGAARERAWAEDTLAELLETCTALSAAATACLTRVAPHLLAGAWAGADLALRAHGAGSGVGAGAGGQQPMAVAESGRARAETDALVFDLRASCTDYQRQVRGERWERPGSTEDRQEGERMRSTTDREWERRKRRGAVISSGIGGKGCWGEGVGKMIERQGEIGEES